MRKQRCKTSLPAILLLLGTLFAFCGCGAAAPGPDEAEARQIVDSLLAPSIELCELYFGAGLPLDTPKNGDGTVKTGYYPVLAEAKYHTISELKAATEAVFTEAYCDILYETAFGEGLAAVTGDEKQPAKSTGRYIEVGGKIRGYSAANVYTRGRTYDLDTLAIVSSNAKTLVVTLTSFLPDGDSASGRKEDAAVTLTFRAERDGWRLDTPTY